ncbi:MAG: trypsin-like peptidase domain-containing protein [Oligoflexia bacterium]|nr:trypsin-like peptidase domain-containing protein [Oligoflexia bacterium]
MMDNQLHRTLGAIVAVLFFFHLELGVCLAKSKVVYGEDNRVDLKDALPLHQQWARSVLAMLPTDQLISNDFGLTFDLKNDSNHDGIDDMLGRLCEGQRFRDQVTPAHCTGFLVAPDIVITAGHCIKNQDDCSENSFAFDFNDESTRKNEKGETIFFIKSSDVYHCKEVVAQRYDPTMVDMRDFSIIRLDRKVTDRVPLKVRREGRISETEELVLVGHPWGMPMKIATGASIRKNDNDIFFTATTDSFKGNSGSPVFNAKSGEVEGVLVRGEVDYEYDDSLNCIKVKVCKEEECMGEDVTRTTIIPMLY